MLITALAWNLKAWLALRLPETSGRGQAARRAQKQQLLKLEPAHVRQRLAANSLPGG